MTGKPDVVTAALDHASSALAEAAKLLSANVDLTKWESQLVMPDGGSIRYALPDLLSYEIELLIDAGEDHLNVGNLRAGDVRTDEAIAALQEPAREFDKIAFKIFVDTVKDYYLWFDDETEEDAVAFQLEDAKYAIEEFWQQGGAVKLYAVLIGINNVNDIWPTQGKLNSDLWIGNPDGFIEILDKRLRYGASATRGIEAAHALQSRVNTEAESAILRHTDGPQEVVQRGPEHDTIVYSYKGENSTIAGASARGMYVAELAKGHLRDESRELGHCIGNPRHGHPQLLESGTTKVFSIRTEAGKSKFTIEQFIADGDHPQQGNVKAGTITEVKGKGNRLPGFEPGSATLTKPDEVKLVTEFLIKYLHKTPAEIEATHDIRGGVLAMKAMGLDPFSPPPAKPPRPKRDPRSMQAAARLVRADFARVPRG